jgi:hypothetical protein
MEIFQETELGEFMTRDEFLTFQKETFDKLHTITKAKNADYTGDENNAFTNFERVEQLGITSVEQGFLVRMTDKMSRISTFVKQGHLQVKDESVKDTLFDLANYSILLAGYIESKKRNSQKEG